MEEMKKNLKGKWYLMFKFELCERNKTSIHCCQKEGRCAIFQRQRCVMRNAATNVSSSFSLFIINDISPFGGLAHFNNGS